MQKFRLFLALACVASVLGFVSCGTEAETEFPRTVVTGQVLNRPADAPTTMLWNVCDPFSEERVSVDLSEDGSFRMETQEVSLLCNHTLRYGSFINFFVAPGDSIHVVIDRSKEFKDAVTFSGDRAEQNNELWGCYNYMSGVTNADLHNRLNMDMEPAAMIAQLNERLEKYQDSLAAYEKRQTAPLSDDLKDFIRRDAIFSLSNQIDGYEEDDAKTIELFSDPFFGMDDPKNFITMMFPYHLSYYGSVKISSDTTVKAALDRSDYSTVVSNGIRVLMREPASLARDVMMWSFLSRYIGLRPSLYDSTPEIKARKVFTDARLDAKLENMVKKLTSLDFPVTPIKGVSYLEPSDSTVIKLPKGDVFAHLAQKYPNKVLYIDVYATWCSYCLIEMKNHTPALHEAVKGKDVVFVNLCLSSHDTEWLKIVKQYNLSENYWFDIDAGNIFMATYRLSGFPSYVLVGKDGKIANTRAEKPSHLKAAVEQIEELLAK